MEEPAALVVRLVDNDEGRRLNREFSGVDRATNVLSFPFEVPSGVPQRRRMLGDIVLCAPLTLAEASAQGKSPEAHYAHLLVHGVLHLLGFEHQVAEQAERMEALETKIITGLGYPDPYLSQD
jgi:probable rRNA maturation factor